MIEFIKANFQYNGRQVTIDFPCSESELCTKLIELHAPEDSTELFLKSIEYPLEFPVLENTFVNLDEMNFLAKRMESFCGDEDLQFFEAMRLEKCSGQAILLHLERTFPICVLLRTESALHCTNVV